MAKFDPNASASQNYLFGLQAARKASGAHKKIQPLIDAHLNRDRSKEVTKTKPKRSPKESKVIKPSPIKTYKDYENMKKGMKKNPKKN